MPQERTRKIVIAGILSAISIFLGVTRLGFITLPWNLSLTIMHIPVIIGAILEGPVVGLVIGLIFGVSSMIQALTTGSALDAVFTNPLIAVLPRLFVGPIAWLVWKGLQRWRVIGLIAAGLIGSLAHTLMVLTAINLFAGISWAILGPVIFTNGIAEAVASAVLVVAVVAAYWQFQVGKRQGANI